MSESTPKPPPTTGVPQIDEALAAVDLEGPVSDHANRIAQAVDVLQQALRNPPAN